MGARLLAATERPRTFDRPYAKQSLDCYLSVSLKELSFPLPRRAETIPSVIAGRGFDFHANGLATAPVYLTSTSTISRVRSTSDLNSKLLTRPGEPLQVSPKRQTPEIPDEKAVTSKQPQPEAPGMSICSEQARLPG